MPTYTWGHDDHEWEVMVPMSRCEEPQECPQCGKAGEKRSYRDAPNIDKVAAGAWNQASYNPALGCWTKSWKHGREIAKSRGLVEVGNESVEKIHRDAEKQRADKREAGWNDATRVMKYD